ncbi:hypothetical protein [Rhodococcus sp. BS-15]|nr:hypothetical protein [Rhodococcus sp. BS-15]
MTTAGECAHPVFALVYRWGMGLDEFDWLLDRPSDEQNQTVSPYRRVF